jgi:hypothetical protein
VIDEYFIPGDREGLRERISPLRLFAISLIETWDELVVEKANVNLLLRYTAM